MTGMVTKTQRGSRGFTLVEMLVVIAILAILMYMMAPVFAKVREKARQSTCLSNQRQIGIEIMTITRDASERFPTAEEVWTEVSLGKDVLVCPSNREEVPNSYGYNGALAGQPIASVESTSTTILLGDAPSAAAASNNVVADPGQYDRRHNGRFIACFVDTHVKLIKDPPAPGGTENY